jgi:hypothetical protein
VFLHCLEILLSLHYPLPVLLCLGKFTVWLFVVCAILQNCSCSVRVTKAVKMPVLKELHMHSAAVLLQCFEKWLFRTGYKQLTLLGEVS